MVQGFDGGVYDLLTSLAESGQLADHGIVVHAKSE